MARRQKLKKNSPSECPMEGTSDIWGLGSHCGETSQMAPRIPLPLGRRLKRKVEVSRVSNRKQLNRGFIHC